MAELETVARPYAEAAFETARDAKALPQWSSALQVAAAVVADPRMQGALDNPRLTTAEKESLFLSVAADGFPPLPSCKIGLVRNWREQTSLTDALASLIIQSLDNLAQNEAAE